MGFGLLFLGYVMMLNFPYRGFDVFPDILGYVLMFIAMKKLSQFNQNFTRAKIVLYPLMGCGIVILGLQIIGLLGYDLNSYVTVVTFISIAVLFVYHYFILFGIRDIAIETDVKKIAEKSSRNWIVTIIYYVITIISMIDLPQIKELIVYFGMPLYFFGIIWLVLNLVLIFSCYMWICLEGDEDMPIKHKK